MVCCRTQWYGSCKLFTEARQITPNRGRCCPDICKTLCRHADVWPVVRFAPRVSCLGAGLSALDVAIRGGLFYLLSRQAGSRVILMNWKLSSVSRGLEILRTDLDFFISLFKTAVFLLFVCFLFFFSSSL